MIVDEVLHERIFRSNSPAEVIVGRDLADELENNQFHQVHFVSNWTVE
jgi:hypothetical protein